MGKSLDQPEYQIRVDKQQRITASDGRPLRNSDIRSSGRAPFHGRKGKPHPNAAYLAKRREDYEETLKRLSENKKSGYRRPGSLKRK